MFALLAVAAIVQLGIIVFEVGVETRLLGMLFRGRRVDV